MQNHKLRKTFKQVQFLKSNNPDPQVRNPGPQAQKPDSSDWQVYCHVTIFYWFGIQLTI